MIRYFNIPRYPSLHRLSDVARGIVFLVMILLLAACHDDKPDPPAKVSKTIFIHLPWTASATSSSGSLYTYFLMNINMVRKGIESQGGAGNNRVIIFIAESPNAAHLIEIKMKGQKTYLDTIQSYRQSEIPAYTSTTGMASLLQHVKQIAPAAKYAMIVGCHGMGWLYKDPKLKRSTRFFGGSTSGYQMDIDEFASALQQSDTHLETLIFDDCYLSNVETAYSLRNSVDYMIACTSEIMAYGMPYDLLWKDIAASTPDYGHFAETFETFYREYEVNGVPYPYGALGIIKCSESNGMANIMATINSRYTFNPADTIQLQKLDGLSTTLFYDMGTYLDALCPDPILLSQAKQQLNALVPFKASTGAIYTALNQLSQHVIPLQSFSGITISDPTQSMYNSAALTKEQTLWWTASHTGQ